MSNRNIPISSPLLKIWIYYQYQITLKFYGVSAQISQKGLKLIGQQCNVNQIFQIFIFASSRYESKIIQFQDQVVLLKQYGKGNLLEINEDVYSNLKKLKVNISGLYIYTYPISIYSELVDLKLYKRLVHRIVLSSKQVLKLILLNVLPQIGRRFECYVGIQEYGIYFNGSYQSMDKAYNFALERVLLYQIHYLYSQKTDRIQFRQQGIEQIKQKLKSRNIIYFDNKLVQKLYESFPLLQDYIFFVRRSHGRFLAIISQDKNFKQFTQIQTQIIRLKQLSNQQKLSSISSWSFSEQQSLQQSPSLSNSNKIKERSRDRYKVLQNKARKYHKLDLKDSKKDEGPIPSITLEECFHQKNNVSRISYCSYPDAQSLQEQFDVFFEPIQEKKIIEIIDKTQYGNPLKQYKFENKSNNSFEENQINDIDTGCKQKKILKKLILGHQISFQQRSDEISHINANESKVNDFKQDKQGQQNNALN